MLSTIYRLVAGTVIALSLFGAAGFAQASTLSSSQVSAIITLLKAFGADQSTIAHVQNALQHTATSTGPFGGATSTSTVASHRCIDLSHNIHFGSTDADTDGDVTRLQQFFGNFGSTTGYFGHLTEQAVQNWQASHHIVSSGSASSTGFGYVGEKTRSAMRCATVATTTSTAATTTPSTTTADPVISIATPVAGTSVAQGSTLNVSWSAQNVPSGATVGLYLVDTTTGTRASNHLVVGQPTTGSYTWHVPSTIILGDLGRTLTPGQYQIQVALLPANYCVVPADGLPQSCAAGTTDQPIVHALSGTFTILAANVTTASTTTTATTTTAGVSTATIDPDSLVSNSGTAFSTVSGSASNLSSNDPSNNYLYIVLIPASALYVGSTDIDTIRTLFASSNHPASLAAVTVPVTNGRWTGTIATPQLGSYRVLVYNPNPLGSKLPLTTGTLIVTASTSATSVTSVVTIDPGSLTSTMGTATTLTGTATNVSTLGILVTVGPSSDGLASSNTFKVGVTNGRWSVPVVLPAAYGCASTNACQTSSLTTLPPGSYPVRVYNNDARGVYGPVLASETLTVNTIASIPTPVASLPSARSYITSSPTNPAYYTLPTLLPDSTTFTITAWVKYTGTSCGTILSDSNGAGGGVVLAIDATHVYLRADKNGAKLSGSACGTLGAYAVPLSLFGVSDAWFPLQTTLSNSWHQIVWVNNGSGSVVYVDGAQVGAVAMTGSNVGSHGPASLGRMFDGASGSYPNGADYLNGSVMAQVYTTALSADQVKTLYGKGADTPANW